MLHCVQLLLLFEKSRPQLQKENTHIEGAWQFSRLPIALVNAVKASQGVRHPQLISAQLRSCMVGSNLRAVGSNLRAFALNRNGRALLGTWQEPRAVGAALLVVRARVRAVGNALLAVWVGLRAVRNALLKLRPTLRAVGAVLMHRCSLKIAQQL